MANDWYLPSKDELNQMYVNLKAYAVGGFADNLYWSSSQYSVITGNAWYQYFLNGSQVTVDKTSTIYVRAIRNFTADASLYALRGVGPSGGWICYKSGSSGSITYLEAASSDQSTSHAWSNIIASVSTSTDIGTGLANSNAIIGQVGHTDSAAKLCLDLSSGYDWANLTVTGVPITKVAVDEISTNLAAQRVLKGLSVVGSPSITQYSSSVTKAHMDTWRSMATDVVKYGANNVPTWGEAITQYATAIKALHFNELKQVADDAKNLARCYTNVCAASCGIACTATCTTNCGATCSTTCTATCKNSCAAGGCTAGCTAACALSTCTGTCYTAACSVTCSTDCDSQCGTGSCAYNCLYWCTYGCIQTCHSVCSAGYNTSCANCATICSNSNCKEVCGSPNVCTGSCKTGCVNFCSTTCLGTCYSNCTGICGSGCTGGACSANCTAACTSNGGSCGGTCSAVTCSASCGVNCNVACSTNCDAVTCQYNCYTGCNLGCRSGCTVTARIGTDAGAL